MSTLLKWQCVELFLFAVEPCLHGIRFGHQFFYFVHGFQLSFVTLLEHSHSMLFAQFVHLGKRGGPEFHVTRSVELPAGHCFHSPFLSRTEFERPN